MITRITPGLIPHQNGRKKDIIIVGNNRGSVNEYATVCIDMRVHEMLISACECGGIALAARPDPTVRQRT
jgi:hypothetical protein